MNKKSKILLCDNYIIDSHKKYNIYQLRFFYFILYKFREINYFKTKHLNDDIKNFIDLKLEIEIENDEIIDFFKKSKISILDIQDIIESIPDSIVFIDKDGNTFKKYFIFSYIHYFEFDKLIIKFSEDCIQYVNNIYENFSNLDLNDLNILKSKYSQRMYELSCRYFNQKNYLMKIDVFKRYFNITNKIYSNAEINRRILKLSIQEINNKTKINIEYEILKKRKFISHIKFKFSKK